MDEQNINALEIALSKINLDKMTDRERIEFQNKYNVRVFGKQFGDDIYATREYFFALARFLDPEKNSLVSSYNRIDLALKFPRFTTHLTNGVLLNAINNGKAIVLPDVSKFTQKSQHEDYMASVNVSTIVNEMTIKKHNVKPYEL